MIRFGEIIHARRVALRISLEDLGRKAGTTKGYLSGIERGKARPPTPRRVTKLCKVLGLVDEPMQLLAYVEKAPASVKNAERFDRFASEIRAFAKATVIVLFEKETADAVEGKERA